MRMPPPMKWLPCTFVEWVVLALITVMLGVLLYSFDAFVGVPVECRGDVVTSRFTPARVTVHTDADSHEITSHPEKYSLLIRCTYGTAWVDVPREDYKQFRKTTNVQVFARQGRIFGGLHIYRVEE